MMHSSSPQQAVVANRAHRGRCAHLSGQSAEDQVASAYEQDGWRVAHKRWRGKSGEIDLIFEGDDGFIMVEVKKSRDHDTALSRLGARQIARLWSAAEEFLATTPKGALTDIRFDVALLNGRGEHKILENAFA